MKDNNELMKNNNKEHKLANAIKSVKWLLFWIALAMLFCAGIYFKLGCRS